MSRCTCYEQSSTRRDELAARGKRDLKMTKLASTLNRLDALHQLPDDHPIAQRERISLAHIDTAGLLKAHAAKVCRKSAAFAALNAAAVETFSIGQVVINRMNNAGVIVSIEPNKIGLEIGGTVRYFAPTTLKAV